jgi:hypothetical protein
MTTHDSNKSGDKKKKVAGGKPRDSELKYLMDLGESIEGVGSKRRESSLSVSLRFGNDLKTKVGRECERDRKYFMGWLRSQTGRADSIGRLARELEAHERNLNGEAAPNSWIKVKSRITRGIIGGGRELRGVVDSALAEFRTSVVLPHERAKESTPVLEAAE